MSKELLDQAAALCAEASRIADRHADYLTRKALVTPPAAHPSITTELANIAKTLEAADKKAASKDHSAAVGLLTKAKEDCAAAKTKKEAAEAYATKAGEVGNLLTALPDTAPTLATEVVKIKQAIAAAKVEADKLDLAAYAKAQTLLSQAETLCDAAAMKKKMAGKGVPTEAELQKLMKAPEGAKMLDAMVQALPEDAPISVIQAVMKERFKLTLVDVVKEGAKDSADVSEAGATADDKSLRKVYELMAKVPGSHTKENPSFKQIKRYAGDPGEEGKKARDKGSFYRGSEGLVVLSCGRPSDTYTSELGVDTEVPPEAKAHLEGGPAPTYFSWTTLHEVGHAVDDKKGFMKKNSGNAAYGGWIAHGGDVIPAAEAAAAVFKYDVNYIARLLTDDTPNPPQDAPPLRPDWDECRAKAEQWCAAVRVGKSLWKNGSEAANRALDVSGRGKVVFHEAYPGTWVSYLLSARSAGVSGYQFRAPGEWFAELYAAYGSKKLKPSHPAYGWLQKLFKNQP